MSVFVKLMKARVTLQACKLEKTGHNKFAGYKYFELGDFIPQIQEIFNDLGLCGIVSYGKEEATLTICEVDAKADDPMIEIKSPMSSAALKGCHEVQNLGAVETYIRRYLWVTALEIVEHDVLDAVAGKETSGKGVIKPSDGVEDRIDPSRREALERVRNSIVDYISAGQPEEAVRIGKGLTDPDEAVYVFDKLDASMRSLIKRTKQEMALKDKK